MIGALNSYPSMKDAGVPWLGEVPEHWEIQPLGRTLRVKSGDMISPDDEREIGVPIYGGNGIRGYTFKPNSQGPTILLGRVGTKCGCVHLVDGPFWASEHALRVIPQTHVNLEFLALVLEHADLNRMAIRTAQPLINSTIVRTHRVAIPSLPEQAAIVRFLNHADRRIRRYIHAKQKLIKLLEEQKQATIHRAVTRGLDPNVHLKPSGVEWLGDVPEHWEVLPLKFVSAHIQNGATPSTSEAAFYENGTVPWYGPSSCAHGEFVKAPVRHLAEAAFAAGRARLIHGPALLVVVIGATAGRMALLAHDGATNQQITSHELRTQRVFPRFVLHQLRGAERWLRSTASTATIPILDGSVVSRLPLAMPSVTEQESILRYADEDTVDLAKAIDRASREIALLREYRTRLIADMVTGKLDVREAAARLPDEAEEPEPLDEADGMTEDEEESSDDVDAAPEEAET